jgi:transcriptional regulator with XRE-family HTH domain
MEPVLRRLGRRIRDVRDAQNLSQTALGQLIGVAKQTISQWERGISPPLITNLVRLAAVTEVTLADLLKDLDNDLDAGDPAVVRARLSARMVPLCRQEQLDRPPVQGRAPQQQPDTGFVATNFAHSARAFAVRLSGSSMLPRFLPCDLIVIDPEVQADPGTFILARTQDQVLFRRYRPKQAGTFAGAELMALNPDWPTVMMTSNDIILGVLTEHVSHG